MAYPEVAPADLVSAGVGAPWVTDTSWLVRWDRVDPGQLVRSGLAPTVDLHTSGTTGQRQTWRRTREQLWAEAGLLAGLVRPDRPLAVAAFAPPRHLFGALASVLVPARLGLPVWYRSGFFGALPPAGPRRWAVMATPWIFTLLLEHLDWVRAMEQVTILHSTAMLPAAAGDLLAAAEPGQVRITEVFGSTETGGIASRRWAGGNPPWELFDDVGFALPESTVDGEVPLVVRSPRLAAKPFAAPPHTWELDDFVVPLDDRRFRLTGRRSRLVKVNGRRLNLDELERSLRGTVRCTDLAIVPVADPMIGEHFDLLVVPEPAGGFDASAAIAQLGVRPRRIRLLERIERTETGKLRRIPPADHPGAGVAG